MKGRKAARQVKVDTISDREILELIHKGIDHDGIAAKDPRATRKRLKEFFGKLGGLIGVESGMDTKKSAKPALRVSGHIQIYTDGASRGNPGKSGIGVVVLDGDKNVLAEVSEYIGDAATNNVAEYKALIRGVEKALEFSPSRVDVFADSELMVRQLNGRYKVRAPSILPLYNEARKLLGMLSESKVQYIPREQNSLADALANRAIDMVGD
ncbi:MAG: ribonuclease HI family protein [Planctomycetota bacterium]|jgi:ribonuclease HI